MEARACRGAPLRRTYSRGVRGDEGRWRLGGCMQGRTVREVSDEALSMKSRRLLSVELGSSAACPPSSNVTCMHIWR